MAESENGSASVPPQPEWREAVKKRALNMLIGERAVNVGRMGLQAALNRRLVRKTLDGTLGSRTHEPEDSDDMGVNVGDNNVVNHNYYQAPKPSGLGTLGKLLGFGALALTTGGIGAVGGLLLANLLKTPAAEKPDTDTDTSIIPGLR